LGLAAAQRVAGAADRLANRSDATCAGSAPSRAGLAGLRLATLSPEEAKALSDLLQQNQIPNPNYVKAVKPPKK
jgi:hypothetical protein